ncbi:uncharacterized protein LOC123866116 isoform X2 [Maniola jurtina]|uniref:uncharacterized protein LOC123866116 isoform X2 n=1 Tax=Maniola jurtina TaxID=191418 RepID=UPI001E68965B|nr:uncharacterized protein LOC123866116 isoform X2 [Maniola jurtina]
MRKLLYTLFMIALFANNWTVYNNEEHPELSNMDDLYFLTSFIYKKTHEELHTVRTEKNHPRSTTISPAKHFSNNAKKAKLHQTQKATLSDVLMMKLVSYYEEKYKVADHEPTERETKTPVLSENDILDTENKDALRIGYGYKNLKSYSNIMDEPEVVIA